MLYKPSNPSPYNLVIDADEALTFSVSCISTSDVKRIRLAIKDDTYDYYFPIGESVTASCKSSYGSSISIPIGISSTEENNETADSQLQFEKGYQIKSSGAYTRTDIAEGTLSSIRDKLSNLNQYRWQLRLYQSDDENSATMNIGYGFVQDVIKYNNSDNSSTRRILKVRPHTNMFMGDTMRELPSDGKNHSHNRDIKNEALKQYYDKNVAYYMQIGGNIYKIKDYYYSKTNAYYSNNQWQNIAVQTQYDEPLFAYIEVDCDASNTDESDKVIEAISEGDQYTILTNYIDSNEYYFSCRQLGTLKFTDPRITGENKEVKFVSIDELDANPDDHIYSPTHSNVQIKGSFDSKSGAAINYYKATLYQVLSNGEDIQIHDSGYVYGSEIDYDCKDLLSGNLYKLVIAVADNYGNTVSKGVYIEPDCHSVVKTTLLSVTPYPEHNSVILDFGKLISITGEQSNPYDESYTISTLKGDWCDDVQQYVDVEDGSIQLFSADTESERKHVEVNTCAIAPDNTVTFSKIDNTGEALKCKEPLISMTFRCNYGSTQTIFDFLSDKKGLVYNVNAGNEIGYLLKWDKYKFCLQQYKRVISNSLSFAIVNGKVVSLAPTSVRQVFSTKYYSPYGDMKDSWENDIHDAMKSAEKDYSVPYLAYENIRIGANPSDTDGGAIRLHTESPAHDFWWQAIVSSGYVYIKCLNPPENMNWEYEWGGASNG